MERNELCENLQHRAKPLLPMKESKGDPSVPVFHHICPSAGHNKIKHDDGIVEQDDGIVEQVVEHAGGIVEHADGIVEHLLHFSKGPMSKNMSNQHRIVSR